MAFARFMASPLGRGGRIVLGLILVASGIGIVGGERGSMLAIAGLLPLGLGIINGCIFGPLFRVPFRGSQLPR